MDCFLIDTGLGIWKTVGKTSTALRNLTIFTQLSVLCIFINLHLTYRTLTNTGQKIYSPLQKCRNSKAHCFEDIWIQYQNMSMTRVQNVNLYFLVFISTCKIWISHYLCCITAFLGEQKNKETLK